jgi:hypothetical protein
MTGLEPDAVLLRDIVMSALSRFSDDGWELRHGEFWTHLAPPDAAEITQGWKIHIAATPLSAAVVLSRAAPILLSAGVAFKFARSLRQVAELTSTVTPRGQGGKVITAYPVDAQTFRQLAGQLDAATRGLPGPAILSDRPWSPGSIVSYRFGAFRGTSVLTNSGTVKVMLTAPDGTLVDDERLAWYSPPDWAENPLADAPAAPRRPEAVMLKNRYVVRRALRHANKGGVFLAEDSMTGGTVVIKQARAHVGATLAGTDVRDLLRNEAMILDLLSPDRLVPRRIDTFEAGDALFLAQEYIDGVTLAAWTDVRLGICADQGIDVAEAMLMARQLSGLLDRVHQRGLVLRDFKPTNVMVNANGELRLIDLEAVAYPGEFVSTSHTPDFAAPEQLAAPAHGPAPGQSADLHALGVSLYFIAAGIPPKLAPDEAPQRSRDDRLALLVGSAAARNPALKALSLPILHLMATEPGERWSLGQVRDFLATPVGAVTGGERISEADRASLLRDGLDHLRATASFGNPDEIWLSGAFGSTTTRTCVQHGAAGVLGTLVTAAEGGEDVADLVSATAHWLRKKVAGLPRRLPGLYFGSSGTAVALYRAARLCDEEDLAAEALDLARSIPLDWACPDVGHGLSGAGLAFLSLWQASGDDTCLERAGECADRVAGQAVRGEHGVTWPIPRDFDPTLGGTDMFGFAHGVAGVGAFLLSAAAETGHQGWLDLAVEAGATLAAAATVEEEAVIWPRSVGEPPSPTNPMSVHWCSGASGIGTFLVRLGLATGDQVSTTLARRAGHTVHGNLWRSSAAACHGLAGNGEFLLDLAEAEPGSSFGDAALDLATALAANDVVLNRRRLITDESRQAVVADYGTGLAGALAFLLRLRDRGPRLWLPQAP